MISYGALFEYNDAIYFSFNKTSNFQCAECNMTE